MRLLKNRMPEEYQEQTYYVIHSTIAIGNNERLFPFSFHKKSESDNFMNSLNNNDSEIIHRYFPNDPDIQIIPFLYFEKTMVSKDQIETFDSLLNKPTGRITSSIIPMDYISEIFLSKELPNSKNSILINRLLDEANLV